MAAQADIAELKTRLWHAQQFGLCISQPWTQSGINVPDLRRRFPQLDENALRDIRQQSGAGRWLLVGDAELWAWLIPGAQAGFGERMLFVGEAQYVAEFRAVMGALWPYLPPGNPILETISEWSRRGVPAADVDRLRPRVADGGPWRWDGGGGWVLAKAS